MQCCSKTNSETIVTINNTKIVFGCETYSFNWRCRRHLPVLCHRQRFKAYKALHSCMAA